jgi:hypothetical protein
LLARLAAERPTVSQRKNVFAVKNRPKDMTSLKKQLTKLAERLAREGYGIDLDYTTGSVSEVEAILGDLHKEYRRSRNMEGIHGIALEFGAYLISVIERNFGKGTWRRDHPEMGSETFPYEWNGTVLFPYSWCLKRLVDGPADDVQMKFQTFVVQRAAAG